MYREERIGVLAGTGGTVPVLSCMSLSKVACLRRLGLVPTSLMILTFISVKCRW